MPSEMYVALSGQVAMEKRLNTIANNVANMNTAGFRAESVHFDTVLSDYRRDSVAFVAKGEMHIDRRPGPVEATGNPLDVAIDGEGWFGIDTPSGRAYTRDGRFTVNAVGDLVTLTGYNVVDRGGAPIALDPEGGPISIAADGQIRQGGEAVGVIGLFTIPRDAGLTRYGDTAVLPDVPAEPVLEPLGAGVRQGYSEGSNVDSVRAITELITVQRAFEQASTAVGERQRSLQEAVRVLGGQ